MVAAMSTWMSACTTAPAEDDEASEIEEHIDEELTGALGGISDPNEIKMFLCRKGDLSEGIFSLRSFSGRLCEDNFVSGLKLVGGAALLICWDDDFEDFQDSQCAENALDDYDIPTFDESAVTSQMSAIVDEYEALTGAGESPFYAGVQRLFCLIPAQLLGPADAVHAIWCGT